MTTTTANPKANDILDSVKQKYGFVPNLIQEMSVSVPTAQVYLNGQEILANGALTAKEQQAVQLTVSSVNRCHYCQAAHRFLSGLTGISSDDVQAIQSGEIPAESEVAPVVEITRLLMEKRGWLSPDEVQQAERKGIARTKLYEIITYIGLKTITNYINHIAQTPVDAQFGGNGSQAS